MNKDFTGEGSEKGGPRRRAVRLHDKKDARRLIGQSVNFMIRGELSAEKGRAILYGASIFLRSIEVDEARWASSGLSPPPATIAAQIRQCMRQANGLIPGPPGEAE